MKINITLEDVAGTVVLYNSTIEVLDNIRTYVNQVQCLYVVDNSTTINSELISALQIYPHVYYYSLDGNKGIATALNWAATRAIADGFKVLLTMDDDTRAPDGMILQMISFWNDYSRQIGILSGIHQTDPDIIIQKPDQATYRTLLYTLTSGNILNLFAYQEVGRFWDELFIDHVDHEYGIRLNSRGYQVIELISIQLIHKLGYRQKIKIGDWVLKKYGTHPPIRLYYFARNGVHIARLYFKSHPYFVWILTKELTKRFIKAGFLDKNRMKRIGMLLKGIRDGWHKQTGQYLE